MTMLQHIVMVCMVIASKWLAYDTQQDIAGLQIVVYSLALQNTSSLYSRQVRIPVVAM